MPGRSLLRTLLLALVCAAALLVGTATGASAADSRHAGSARLAIADSGLALGIVGAVNDFRLRRGLTRLSTSAALSAAAAEHSASMGLGGYFSHDSADGSPFWRRVTSLYKPAGFRSWSLGENLLWSAPPLSAASALGLWLASPEHRAVLLGRNWREIGLSVVHVASAEGVYGGQDVTIVAAEFGVRRS